MFNFDVCDDKQSTIKCAAFGDVAERTYTIVQENQVSRKEKEWKLFDLQ